MKYLLDTNTCIAFLKSNQAATTKIRSIGIEKLLLCSVVKVELWFSACKSERIAANQNVLNEFFMQFSSIPFDDKAIGHYGEIRALLTKIGKPIGANDLLIAAIAKANQLTLVTHNTKAFIRAPDLLLDDWLSQE